MNLNEEYIINFDNANYRRDQYDFEDALNQISSSVQSEDIEKLLEWKKNNE